MRVTAEKKIETRERIVEAALDLFGRKGFAETTTRDIAKGAGIATGTMFNYFDSKEELAMGVLAEALSAAEAEFAEKRRGTESLVEGLFGFMAMGMRHLKPYVHFVSEVYEQTMTPFARLGDCAPADAIRRDHLEVVWELITAASAGQPIDDLELLTSHLYWSLYLGVMAFWSRDESPHQEDTLAMLDRTTQLFVQSLGLDCSCDDPNASEEDENL